MLRFKPSISLVGTIVVALFIPGCSYFYYYNYIANIRGQARELKLEGIGERICGTAPRVSNQGDQCGKRSIYRDADWGITAYFTLYGVDSEIEAEKIAAFMVDARQRSHQEHIPMNIQIFSISRSSGNGGPVNSRYKIFDKTY